VYLALSMHTILVVEDDTEIRELVAEVLGAEGYAVVQAANGQEALDYLRTKGPKPCVILLDLMMPVLSGPELIEIMAEDRKLASLPVVVVSAIAGRGTAPGVKRFLKKPVSSAVLRRVVAEYCGAADC
jgi:two-component system chemotaxis response regulator CheY